MGWLPMPTCTLLKVSLQADLHAHFHESWVGEGNLDYQKDMPHACAVHSEHCKNCTKCHENFQQRSKALRCDPMLVLHVLSGLVHCT
jgi:hypothetical protein